MIICTLCGVTGDKRKYKDYMHELISQNWWASTICLDKCQVYPMLCPKCKGREGREMVVDRHNWQVHGPVSLI